MKKKTKKRNPADLTKRRSPRKLRRFYLVLFTNVIGEKTGHVYYSKKAAYHFKYPKREIVRVEEIER